MYIACSHNFLNNIQTETKYPHTMQTFLESLPDYGAIQLLNDTQHIIRHKSQPICKHEKCVSLQRATRDRSGKQQRGLSEKKLLFRTDATNDFIYISMLDEVHVLLKHPKCTINTMQALNKNVSDIKKRQSKFPIFNTGVYIDHTKTSPLYPNLKQEMTKNKSFAMEIAEFELDLESAKLFMQTDNIQNKWRASRTDEKHGIQIDQKIQIENVLCIKLYCNHSKLCTEFRASYYKKANYTDTKDMIVNRHCDNHYWFGRFLTNAIEFYGESPNSNTRFYHGLSGKFIFNHFSAIFETPTSTTSDKTLASEFANDGVGIVLELAPKYNKEISFSKCLQVSDFSHFTQEKEVLV